MPFVVLPVPVIFIVCEKCQRKCSLAHLIECGTVEYSVLERAAASFHFRCIDGIWFCARCRPVGTSEGDRC